MAKNIGYFPCKQLFLKLWIVFDFRKVSIVLINDSSLLCRSRVTVWKVQFGKKKNSLSLCYRAVLRLVSREDIIRWSNYDGRCN